SLVSLTWSLSKLGETGGEEDLFRYTLAPTIRSYMLEYSVQDLCALAWSFANANINDVDFMSDIAHALMPKTRDMNCQDVCSAVVALASLHYSHKELFEALKQQSFRLMQTFTPLQLSRTLYGFGVAGVRDKKLFYEMALTSIGKLHLMYAKNVCDILSALMEADYLIPELTRPLLDHLARQLDRLGPTECVQLLTVVAHVEPSEQRSSLGEAVAEQLRPKMKTTVRWIPSGPEIADVLQSFVLLELNNDRLLENTLMMVSPASKAPSCTSDIFLRILGSCADMPQRSRDAVKVLLHKHVGLQNAFNRLFEELCSSTVSKLDQETLADLVYACARIGYDDGMFVQRLIEHVDQHLASSGGFHSFQSMARLVYALCELNTRLDMARVLCREAIDGQMWEGGSGDDILMLAWAAVFLSLPPPVELMTEMCILFEERLPTQLLMAQQIAVQLEYSDDYVDVNWDDPRVDTFVKDVRTIKRNDLYPVVYGKKANHRGTALMHTTTAASWVSAALEQLRIPHKASFVIDNLYRVAAGFPGQMAALDVLCPDSLVSPGGTRPLGSAAMRHRQLAALGWAVKDVTQREVYDAIVTRSVNSFIAKQIGPIHPNAVKYIEWGKVEVPDIEVKDSDGFPNACGNAGKKEAQSQEEDTTDYGPAATDALKSLAWRYWGDIWRSLYYYIPIRECAEEFRMQRRDDRQCTLGPVERKTITSLEGILVDEAFDAPFNTYAAAGLFALVSWRFLRAYPPLINRPATVLSSAFVPPGLFCLWRRSYMKRGMICQFIYTEGQNSQRAQEIIDLYHKWCPDDYEFMKGRPGWGCNNMQGFGAFPDIKQFSGDLLATVTNCRALFTCYARSKLGIQTANARVAGFNEFESNIILKDGGSPFFVSMLAALMYPLVLRRALSWPTFRRLPLPIPHVVTAIPSIGVLYVSMLHHFRSVIRDIVNFDGPLSNQDRHVRDVYKQLSPTDYEVLVASKAPVPEVNVGSQHANDYAGRPSGGDPGIQPNTLAALRRMVVPAESQLFLTLALVLRALIDCCKELKLPEEASTSTEGEHRGGLTIYESDMLNTGSPIALGLLAGLTYPVAWRSVSRMHLFRNRPVLPQFLAIVPPVAFLYVAGVYNCRVVMSRFVRDEGERSQRARDVVALYREKAPVDYAALRQGMAGRGLTLVPSGLMSKLSEETQDLLLRTKIDDVLRKSLLKFLEQIGEEPRADLFLVPVNLKDYPSYTNVVKRPMDLSTMEMKLKGQRPRGRKPRVPRPPIQKYQYVQDVFNDLEQIWTNSTIFNEPGCDAYADALEMREITRSMVDEWVIANIPNGRMKEVEPSPTVRLTAEALREVSEAEGEPGESVSAPTKKSRKDSKKGDGSSKLSKRKKKRKKRAASESSSSDGDLDSPASPSSFPAPAALDRFSLLTPSPGERNALAARITRLHPENLARIVKLLTCSEQSEKDALAMSNGEGDGSVFTIKLDLIDNKTFWVLSNLVKLQLRQQEHEQYKRYHDKIATVSTTTSQEKEPPPLWRKCLAEVFGTAVLLAFGSGV
ncbi:hypothetical protein FOZ63_030850, partial [Perkinsus olseni]